MSSVVRIAVIDDHPLMREGIVHALSSQPMFELVGEGESKDDAIQIAGRELPDILLLDLSMPGGGLAAARYISEKFPSVKLVILTVSENEQKVATALELGARGYLLKGIGGMELERALLQVQEGKTYVAAELAGRLFSRGNNEPISSLTVREKQVVSLIRHGFSNREIGERLSLSEKTVKYYLTGIYQKLGVRNRAALASFAQSLSDIDEIEEPLAE